MGSPPRQAPNGRKFMTLSVHLCLHHIAIMQCIAWVCQRQLILVVSLQVTFDHNIESETYNTTASNLVHQVQKTRLCMILKISYTPLRTSGYFKARS